MVLVIEAKVSKIGIYINGSLGSGFLVFSEKS
jgi:hypothetical protein